MKDRKLVLTAAIVVAIILAGEAYVCLNDWDGMYGVGFSEDGDSVSVSIKSGGSKVYDIVAIGNGSFSPASEVILYYDPGQGEMLDETWHATGGKDLDQEYYISQLAVQLKIRGVDARIVDATGLKEMMETALSGEGCDQAVFMASGALPDTVYSGDPSDTVVRWLSEGGRLYWAGNILGAYISSSDGTVRQAGDGYRGLFFAEGIQNTNETYGLTPVDGNPWREALCLAGNGTAYGLDASKLEGALSAGYTDGTYSSVCLVGYGKGMVCVFGGVLSNDQRSDVAQVIASGLSNGSTLLSHIEGTATRTTVVETVDSKGTGGNISVYAYIGGYFTVRGGCFATGTEGQTTED